MRLPAQTQRILVTGGAGFIGSHLVNALMAQKCRVIVLDNLSNGRLENIESWHDNSNFTFKHGDLLKPHDLTDAIKNCEVVYHLAANPEVRISSVRPDVHFDQNVVSTYRLLEKMRKTEGVETLVFTSSSTVYGEATEMPTPEDYAPLRPISVHGACKLACEALATAYADTYGFGLVIYRLANIVGSRSSHGVLPDFIAKLRDNPLELEILGDGTQKKSYLHVSDCVKAMLVGFEKSRKSVEIFNVGSEDQIDVKTIAETVIEEMSLKKVVKRFTGGVEDGRGWKGDVKNMLLDVRKLRNLGWKPQYDSEEAMKKAIQELLNERISSEEHPTES